MAIFKVNLTKLHRMNYVRKDQRKRDYSTSLGNNKKSGEAEMRKKETNANNMQKALAEHGN